MKIQKFEYESLIRDSERLSIIDTVVTDYHYLDMQLLRILCGRQQKDIPNIQPTEPAIMIESVEEPAKESIHEIMEKFHSEEEPEPPKDSTPPLPRIPPDVWIPVPTGKKSTGVK